MSETTIKEREPIDPVEEFIQKICQATGEIIPLPGKRSKLNEELSISARYGEDSFSPHHTYLLIDVFANRSGDLIPVGMRDWEIKSPGVASGNKQRHGHLPATSQSHVLANSYWSSGHGIRVRDEDFLRFAGSLEGMDHLRERGIVKNESWNEQIYQKMGIGSLMIAISLLILEKNGIQTLDASSFSQSAKATWKKFGRVTEDEIGLDQLIDHPFIRQTIRDFVEDKNE